MDQGGKDGRFSVPLSFYAGERLAASVQHNRDECLALHRRDEERTDLWFVRDSFPKGDWTKQVGARAECLPPSTLSAMSGHF